MGNYRIEVLVGIDEKTAKELADKVHDFVEDQVECAVCLLNADTGEEVE